MKVKINIDWRLICLVVLAVVFFFIYSFLSFDYIRKDINNDLILTSPDEISNYYFAYLYSNTSKLQFNDIANQIVDDLVTPRSMKVINGNTVPASFIGFSFIAGLLAKLFSDSIIHFIIPLFSCLGIIFFYLLIKELFNHTIAFLSSTFLIINPAWWYYSLRNLMPNVLFISLVIISLYFLIVAVKKKLIIYYLLFGFFLGLALMVRTSEVTWLAPLLLFLMIVYRKQMNWQGIILSFVLSLITFLPVFYFNYQNYQSLFSFGYAVDLDLQGKNFLTQGLNIFEKIFLPFGFQPKTALINLYNYTINIFPFWSLVSLISLFFFSFIIIFKKDVKRIIYLLVYLIISGYLVIYYGSWVFYDNPDPIATTIGNSYIRYWLIIYIFILPMVGYCLYKLYKFSRLSSVLLTIVLFIFLGNFSFNTVFYGEGEGIYYVYHKENYQRIQNLVNSKIEDNAIIIADRMDKVFFPRHSVIFRLNNDNDYQRVYNLIEAGYPVYYFYFTRDSNQLKEFNERYYLKHLLEVQPSLVDFEEQSLYPIIIHKINE